MAVWAQLTFLQLVFPIHLYNFTPHHWKKSILFKGGCINWLGKSSFYSPPQQYEHQCCASEIDILFISVEGEERKKMHVFKLEASLNWWAPGVELFCGEIICIMGKWLELEPRALLLWGQSVKWKGRAPIRQKANTKVLREGDVCFWYALLPPVICKTIYQQSLRQPICTSCACFWKDCSRIAPSSFR